MDVYYFAIFLRRINTHTDKRQDEFHSFFVFVNEQEYRHALWARLIYTLVCSSSSDANYPQDLHILIFTECKSILEQISKLEDKLRGSLELGFLMHSSWNTYCVSSEEQIWSLCGLGTKCGSSTSHWICDCGFGIWMLL